MLSDDPQVLSRGPQVLSMTGPVLSMHRIHLTTGTLAGSLIRMSILDQTLTEPLHDAALEVELARRIEAGLYAEQLLAGGSRHDPSELESVRRRGTEAWQRLWTTNLRLVMKIALEFAQRHLLPVDDLFQDGCLGLAVALQRFDHARGLRFTTFAHDHIWHHIATSAATRCGTIQGSPHRQRIRHRIRSAVGATEAELLPAAEVAARTGITVDAVHTSRTHTVGFDELPPALTLTTGHFADVDRTGTDFLNLLPPRQAELLRLRYGLAGPALSLKETAQRLGMSPTTARRVSAEALRAARLLLEADRCVLPESMLDAAA